MRVIVTRVQPQAARWVQWLAPLHAAVALPLIETHALTDNSELVNAWRHWADYVAVMFVSSHAVDYFFASKQDAVQMECAQGATNTRAWATGPGTRAALLAQGLDERLVDAPPVEGGQYDSEALWQQVQAQIAPGARVLIVRGDTGGEEEPSGEPARRGGIPGVGRDWLAQRLQSAGAHVDFVVAYRRGAPLWTQLEFSLAREGAADGSVWLFSSAEALVNLQTLLPGQSWTKARAVATHARIAQAARQMGFGVVSESRPILSDVLASIESMP
jgi:uroporphyrinogen-III synthase